jgi:hypothetical protein
MPLSKEELESLKKTFRAVKAKPCPFLYCVAGPEGEPVLMVDRRKLDPQEVRALKRGAKKKLFARGTVLKDAGEGRYVFSTLKAAPALFEKHLRTVFAQAVPGLRKADVRLMALKEAVVEGQKLASEAEKDAALEERWAEQVAGELDRLVDQRKGAEVGLEEARAALAELEGAWISDDQAISAAKKAVREAERRLKKLKKAEGQALIEQREARDAIAAAAEEARELRAASDDIMARWSDEQAAFWREKRADPVWRAEVGEATRQRAEAAEAHRVLDERLAAVRATMADNDRVIRQAQEKLSRQRAELVSLSERIVELEADDSLSLAEVEELEAAQTRLGRLKKRIEKLDGVVGDRQQSSDDLDMELYGLERRTENARIQAEIARARQESMLRSDAESALVTRLVLDQSAASIQVHQLDEQLAAQQARVEELRGTSTALTAAEDAMRQAQIRLHAAQLHRQQTEEDADLVSFWGWDNSAKVESAKKALPDARRAEVEALAAFKAAQAALKTAREDLDVDTEALIEAEEELNALKLERAEAAREVARLDRQLADESAMVAGVAVDLLRQDRAVAVEKLIATSPAVAAADRARSEARTAAAAVTAQLSEAGTAVASLIAEIAALRAALKTAWSAAGLTKLQELLAALPGLQATQRRIQGQADDALLAQQAAESAFKEQLRVAGDADPELGGLLAGLERAESDVSAAHERSASAVRDVVRSDNELAEAERRDQVIEAQEKLHGLIDDSAELLAEFARMEDATDLSGEVFVIDLLSDEDRAKAEGHPRFKELLALQQKLEGRALRMLRSGATAEELDAAFARVPNGLRPPSYRAEVAAFQVLDRAFDLSDEERDAARVIQQARERQRPEELRAEALRKLSDMAAAGASVDAAAAVLDSDAIKADPSLLQTVVASLTRLQQTLVDIDAGLMETAQDIHAELAEQLVVLQHAQIDVVALVGPVLVQLAGPAADLNRDIMAAAIRKGQARHTSLLARAAKVSGSPLAGAFEEALAQENRLWSRHAVDAHLDATKIVGRLLLNLPGTEAIGAALEIGAFVGKSVADLGQSLSDWRIASKARSLLVKARAGSARARAELMKCHPLYAKGLIVHMAQSGDPFAKLYMSRRGMDEAGIKAGSLRIMTHYLLEEAEQLDKDGNVKLETVAEWYDRRFAGVRDGIDQGLSQVKQAIARWQDPKAAAEFERLVRVRAASAELAAAFDRAVRVRDQLVRDQDTENLEAVRGLLGDYQLALDATRREAIAGLERLASTERKVALMQRKQGSLEEDAVAALERFEGALPDLRTGYLEIVGSVARAA